MKTLKKINLKGISEFLSERELKNVMGGYGSYGNGDSYTTSTSCAGKKEGDPCTSSGKSGTCRFHGGDHLYCRLKSNG